MRVVGELNHPRCKITVFAWNNRYLIKLENGLMEQTYKINQYDVVDEQALVRMVDEPFIQECMDRFDQMARSLADALERHEP
jgi:hypothetical protein